MKRNANFPSPTRRGRLTGSVSGVYEAREEGGKLKKNEVILLHEAPERGSTVSWNNVAQLG